MQIIQVKPLNLANIAEDLFYLLLQRKLGLRLTFAALWSKENEPSFGSLNYLGGLYYSMSSWEGITTEYLNQNFRKTNDANMSHNRSEFPDRPEGKTKLVFRRYITVKGKKVYPKKAKCFAFWV